MVLYYCLIAFLALFAACDSYKVLVYSPAMGHSHVNFLGKIADTLLDAGHEVLVFLPVMDPELLTNGTNRAKVLRFETGMDPSILNGHSFKTDPFDEKRDMQDDGNLEIFTKIMMDSCEAQISNKELMKTLANHHFDIAITEVFDYCAFGMFKLLNIPSHISACAAPLTDTIGDLFGVPEPLSYVPSLFGSFTDEMGYIDRATNVFMSQFWRHFLRNLLDKQNQLFQQYHGSDFPCLETLAKKSGVAFINANEFVEFPRPVTHRIIYVGGIGVPKPKPLPKDLEDLVSSAKKGVILLSFGSIAKSILLPSEKKMAILNTFASFPEYTFIWKYELPDGEKELFSNYSNVHRMKWVPQVDLLNHPNVIAFITHGGANSMTEAIQSGTPTVAIPLLGDQAHNVAVGVKRGVSVLVLKQNLNAETLTTALREILNNKMYGVNAKRLAEMIEKKPVKPKEMIVKWTEFVAEFQDLSNLDIAGRDLSFIKYFCIDIFAPAIVLLIAVVAVVMKFLTVLGRKASGMFATKQKQS
uniref:UDP-glucuronosyltransferase n=1 Tax=Plectus sambesii TaxID=2011161 RepID=A0A914XNF4_9BILA